MVQDPRLAVNLGMVGYWVQLRVNRDFKKKLRKMGSLYEIIESGKPLCFITISRNNWATCCTVKWLINPPKWAYLLSRSTTTRMVVCPCEVGRPTMKSIVKSSRIWLGIGRGCKSLAGGAVEYLTRWQVSQLATWAWTSKHIFGQWNFVANLAKVQLTPLCPTI